MRGKRFNEDLNNWFLPQAGGASLANELPEGVVGTALEWWAKPRQVGLALVGVVISMD